MAADGSPAGLPPDPFAGRFADPGGRAPAPPDGDRAASRRAFAPLAAVLVLLAVLAGVVALAGGHDSQEPDRVASLTAQAEALRGLTLRHPVPVERLDRGRLSTLISGLLDRDPDPDLSAGADDALHLLGVLRSGQSLTAIVQSGLTGQVAGLYDPKAKRLYVIETNGAEATGSTILHELVHAIQDQRFDLDGPRFGSRVEDADAQAAAQALVEGDATEVQLRFIQAQGVGGILGELGGALSQLQGTPADDLRLPEFLQRSLSFPYDEGVRFVQSLRARGGQALVDRAFADPPDTTIAILDPERYVTGRDAAVPVSVPPPASGTRRVYDETFGAADLLALTGDRGVALAWRGGRMTVDRKEDEARLTMTLASRRPGRTAGDLRRVLPAGVAIRTRGRSVTVTRCIRLSGTHR